MQSWKDNVMHAVLVVMGQYAVRFQATSQARNAVVYKA